MWFFFPHLVQLPGISGLPQTQNTPIKGIFQEQGWNRMEIVAVHKDPSARPHYLSQKQSLRPSLQTSQVAFPAWWLPGMSQPGVRDVPAWWHLGLSKPGGC